MSSQIVNEMSYVQIVRLYNIQLLCIYTKIMYVVEDDELQVALFGIRFLEQYEMDARTRGTIWVMLTFFFKTNWPEMIHLCKCYITATDIAHYMYTTLLRTHNSYTKKTYSIKII